MTKEKDNAIKNVILLNIEAQKVLFDIKRTNGKKDFLLKSKWLNEWKSYVETAFPHFSSLNVTWYSLSDLISLIEENNPNKNWFKEVLIETTLFTPYFPLGSFSKKLSHKIKTKKDNNSFLDEIFSAKRYYSTSERLYITKAYNKAFNSVEEVVEGSRSARRFCLFVVSSVSLFSFITFISMFGGVTKLSLLFALLGSSFGLIGGALIEIVLTIDNLMKNKNKIVEKAKEKALSLVINK